jgi:hypothetical protein
MRVVLNSWVEESIIVLSEWATIVFRLHNLGPSNYPGSQILQRGHSNQTS